MIAGLFVWTGRDYVELCTRSGRHAEADSARLGIGETERALDSVGALLGSAHGIALVYPACTRHEPGLGEISSYPPGYKENGGVFCHTNPWIGIAETVLGRGERAFEAFRAAGPGFRSNAGFAAPPSAFRSTIPITCAGACGP